jgi:UDP-2-acetamido-3-amino-2,3-dideoxy-glucuronate N-acetyltransferase
MDDQGCMAGPRPSRERHVAVIGAGQWGREFVRAFDSLGALLVVCDATQARLDTLVTSDGVKRCSSYDECLKSAHIDAVAIATPAAIHCEMVRSAFAAGKDVLVAMPLALSVKDGRELVDMAASANRVLMTGNALRCHPAVCELKELIDTGDLGSVEYICSNRLTVGPLRPEEGVLWGFAPNEVSVILDLLGEMPIAVSCQGGDYTGRGVSDVTISQLMFAGGVRAQIFVSRMQPFKERWLVVVGSEKMAVFDEAARQALTTYPRSECSHAVRPAPDPAGEPAEIGVAEPIVAQCRAFLDCLEARRPPATGGAEEIRVLEVLEACSRSLSKDGVRILVRPDKGSRPSLPNRRRAGRRVAPHASAGRAMRRMQVAAGIV